MARMVATSPRALKKKAALRPPSSGYQRLSTLDLAAVVSVVGFGHGPIEGVGRRVPVLGQGHVQGDRLALAHDVDLDALARTVGPEDAHGVGRRARVAAADG